MGSLWSDCLTAGQPSWSHLLDTIFACWGTLLFSWVLVFEHIPIIERSVGILGILVGGYCFIRCRRARWGGPDQSLSAVLFWHVCWHIALPSAIVAMGFIYQWKGVPRSPKSGLKLYYPP